MKKIIIYILSVLALLGLLFKVLNTNKDWNTQEFIEYMAEVPQIEVEDTISYIQSDWGIWNFARTFLNTIITVFNFAIKIITNIVNVFIHIIYVIEYFFTIGTNYDNQDTTSGSGGGDGWRGGR